MKGFFQRNTFQRFLNLQRPRTQHFHTKTAALLTTASVFGICVLKDAFQCEKSVEENFEDGSKFYIPVSETSEMQLFAGNGNPFLANEVAMHLGVQLGRAKVGRFADGEVEVQIFDNVRGKDAFVIQPLAPPVNENLMELLLMISTLKRSSARRVTAVIPYFGYGRSTNSTTPKKGRAPIAAADVALMLQVAGADRVIAVDLHNAQIQGFFPPEVPVDNLDVSGIAIPYFQTKFLKNPVIVSPDANGAPRAKTFRDNLVKHGYDDATLAVLVGTKRIKREAENENNSVDQELKNMNPEDMELVGDVNGRDCVIYDDMVDSARTIAKCTKKLKASGARRVFVFCTHGLFLGNAVERIEKSDLIEVVCVNTVQLCTKNRAGVSSVQYSSKIHQLSVAALLAEAIRSMHKKEELNQSQISTT